MTLPSAQDVHQNAVLRDLAIGYSQKIRSVANRAFTYARVEKHSDLYYVFDKGDFFRSEMELRADGSESKKAGFRVSTDNYFCDVYALSTILTDRQKKNAAGELDLESAKIRYLVQQALLKRDIDFATDMFTTGVWSGLTDQTGVASGATTNQFLRFDADNSDPIGVITAYMSTMETASGYMPNVLVTNKKVINVLRHHADFLDRIKYNSGVSNPADVTESLIAQVLGLDEIIVGKAIKNTGKEGQTASMSRVFGDHMLLLHRDDVVSDEAPTAGYTFSWSEFDQVSEDGDEDGGSTVAIDSWYEKKTKSTIYEAEQAYDMKVAASDLGGFLASVVS